MKNLIAVLSLCFVSASASAEPLTAYLVYRTHSGHGVNPMYGIRKSCLITNQGVRTSEIIGDIKTGNTKKISWKGIRNAAILQSLILEAKKGMVMVPKHPLPVGGRMSTYASFIKNKEQKPLKTKVGGILASINTSEAAARLISFIEVNCGTGI